MPRSTMTDSKLKSGPSKSRPAAGGAVHQIREAVARVLDSLPVDEPQEAARSARRQLKKKETKRIVQGTLERYFAKEELKPYQAELIKLQQHISPACGKCSM